MPHNLMIAANPFRPRMISVQAGESLTALADQLDLSGLRCQINAEDIPPIAWATRRLEAGEHCVFYAHLQGGGGGSNPLRAILMIAVAVAAGPLAGAIAPGLAAGSLGFSALQIGITVAGAALVSAILPPPDFSAASPNFGANGLAAPSPTYSLQAQGNQARLGQPIPVIYGRHIVYPDFAATPWTVFDEQDEQYLHQLLVIGQGDYDIEAMRIEDSPLSSFDGVETEIIPPDGRVTLFDPHIIQASEVVGQEALSSSDDGGWLGPFAANPAGTQATKIGIDIVAPRGLFFANNQGNLENKSLSFEAAARTIDADGKATGNWRRLGRHNLSAAKNKPVRRSYSYSVAQNRYEVRFRRLDTRDTRARVGHDLRWAGLKATLTDQSNFGGVTLLAVKMRATDQLSNRSARLINVIAQRRIPKWTKKGGWSTSKATASPAWALADLARNSIYGAGLPERRLDLEGLAAWAATCASTGDEFNGVFDTSLSFHQAAQRIARCGLAAPIQQNGTLSIIRDETRTIPTAMFTPRNIVKGSCSIRFNLPTEHSPDGVEAEYFDRKNWARKTITVGLGEASPKQPAKIQLFGVTDKKQAQRLAFHSAAETRYRRITVVFRTEMEGLIPHFGDLIALSHPVLVASQGGEIVRWDSKTQIATVSEALPLEWDAEDETWLIALRKPNGAPSGDHPVRRVGEDQLRIIGKIDFPIYTGGQRERTHYSIGPGQAFDLKARVIKIMPRANLQVEITAVNDDDRVFDVPDDYLNTPPAKKGGGRGVTASRTE